MIKKWWILYKKEFLTTFSTPVAYVIVGAFLGLFNYFFISSTFLTGYWDTAEVFQNMSLITFMFCPLVAMRFIAEERRNKTMELLLTSPVMDFDIIFSKYLFSLSLFLFVFVITFFIPLIASFHIAIYWPVLLWQYVGLFLLAATLLAIGFVFSSLSENQITAGILSLSFSLFLYLLSFVMDVVPNEAFRKFLGEVTLIGHYQSFLYGIIDVKDVLYFGLAIVFFLSVSQVMIRLKR